MNVRITLPLRTTVELNVRPIDNNEDFEIKGFRVIGVGNTDLSEITELVFDTEEYVEEIMDKIDEEA